MRHRRWILILVLVCFMLLTSFSFAYLPEPLEYLNHLNWSRRVAGRWMLCTDSMLMAKAQIQADLMAANGYIFHSTSLLANVPYGTRYVVENVGSGWTLVGIHAAFLGSVSHSNNVYNPELTHAGVGIAYAGGRKYISFIGISDYVYGCNQ